MAVNLTIKQLRKTAAQWTSDNTILADGVLGFETDTGKYKIGDGVTAWNSLSYPTFGGTWGSITGTLSDQTDLQSALDLKANLAGASFTGDVSVTTSGSGTTLGLTNSGSGTTLNIANSGSGDFLVIDTDKLVVSNNGNLAVDTNTLFVDATNNRVGIGTATPSNLLHINSTSSTINSLYIAGTNPYSGPQGRDYIKIDGSGNVGITLQTNTGGYVAQRFLANSLELGVFYASEATKEFVFKATQANGTISFMTSSTIKAKIMSDGKLGVGTTSPSAKIHAQTSSTSEIGAIIQAAAGQTANLLEIKDSASNNLLSVGSNGKLSIGATGGLRYTPSATRYTDYSGLNLGGGIYMSFPSTGTDLLACFVGGSASSNIYSYWNSAGNINTRGSILVGASDGASTLAGAAASAILDVRSTTKGFLPPRMTGAQVEAISSPAEGLIAYATNAGAGDVTAKGAHLYNGVKWGQVPLLDGGKLSLTSATTSSIPLTVNAAAGQTANLLEVNSSGGSGGNLFRVEDDGTVNIASTLNSIGATLYLDGLGAGGVRVSGSLGTSQSLGAGVQGKVTDTWLNIAASTTTRSAIQMNAGVDPTSPVAGDMWFDGTNLKFYDGSTTHNIV